MIQDWREAIAEYDAKVEAGEIDFDGPVKVGIWEEFIVAKLPMGA